jgi:parvulin-like peptidyl-prolyl isomerase
LQPDQFAKIDEIKAKLDGGEGFPTLAAVYSESESTKDIGGDVGMVTLTDAVPEMQAVLKNAVAGDLVTAHSRYGHHIVKVESIDESDPEKKQFHLREIFLSSTGFEDWYDARSKEITTKRFLHFN